MTTKSSEKAPIPRLSVIERRLQSDNPFGEPSSELPLREPGWMTRFFNTAWKTDRPWWAYHHGGWDYVTQGDLAAPLDDMGLRVNPEGKIVRGPNGAEVLMKMREDDWRRLLARKSAANLKRAGINQGRAALVAEAQQFGEAADQYVREHAIGTVRDWRGPDGSDAS